VTASLVVLSQPLGRRGRFEGDMNTVETKICEDCGGKVVMLLDAKGMLIRYEKMCPCLKKIMKLRGGRSDEFKNRKKTIRDEMRGCLFYKGEK